MDIKILNSDSIATLSFEEALELLEKIVTMLNDGTIRLDVAVEYYQYGKLLHNHCKQKLDNLQLKVQHVLAEDIVQKVNCTAENT